MTQIFKETDYDLQKGESRTRDDSDIEMKGREVLGYLILIITMPMISLLLDVSPDLFRVPSLLL